MIINHTHIHSVTVAALLSFLSHTLTYTSVDEKFLDTELKYYLFAVYNAINFAFCPTVNIIHDFFPVLFMSFTIAMLQELSVKLTQIGLTVEKESKSSQLKLIDCVRVHLKIKEFIRDIEDIFSPVILVQGLIISMILCTNSFMLSLVN